MTADMRKGHPGQSVPPSILAAPSLVPVDARDELAKKADGAFVVIAETNDGLHWRRRCFLSVARAEASGHRATAYLAELKPLWHLATPAAELVSGDEDGGRRP